MCNQICSFGTIGLRNIENKHKEKVVVSVNEPLYKNCGICTGACLSGARQLYGFTDGQTPSMIKTMADN